MFGNLLITIFELTITLKHTDMKTSQNYWNEKNQKVEIWMEETPNGLDFWEKINGVSNTISKRQYKNRVAKFNLVDYTK